MAKMAKNKKPLLKESTVRRMMKLANMDSLGDTFISERKYEWHPGDESKTHPGDHDDGQSYGDQSDSGRGEDFVKEEDEIGSELDAPEDELGAEDEIVDDEAAELDSEVTITDDEAQDIIDLADKLKGAIESPEEEEVPMDMDVEAEEEIDIEEPGVRDEIYEEELYEAALKGLNIDLVEDKAAKRKALVQEAKKRIYERVVRRLIAANKKK